MSAAWVPAGPDVQCAVCHTPAFITGRHEDAAAIWRAWGCPDEACPANSRARLGGRRGPDVRALVLLTAAPFLAVGLIVWFGRRIGGAW